MADGPLVITTLRQAHQNFADLVTPLDGHAVRAPSYCDGWSVAQVASHVGSGAELGLDWLRAAIGHTEPMGHDEVPKVWDAWNARSPEEQVADAVVADAAHVAAFEDALADGTLAGARIKLFGAFDLDGVGLALFRLPELTVHTWDIAVMRDPSARLLPAAVELVVGESAALAGHFGKPQAGGWTLNIATSAPDRAYVLRNGDPVSVEPGTADDADGTLRLPAEALVRLIYGRLDDAHCEGVTLDAAGVGLDDVRAVFPGL